MKRALDLLFASALLLLLLPLLAALALLVRVRLGAPVLFRQQRPGLGGRPFVLLKLRTLHDWRGPDGELLPDVERQSGLGSWLRAWSLDELPQLINVVKGEMSLVGPRPLLMQYLPLYTERQALRHQTHPGITGWAQVQGRNLIAWDERLELDVWYVEHRTLALDLRILWRTVGMVVRREGISRPGMVSTERFRGSLP